MRKIKDRPPTNEVVQLHNQEGVDSLPDAERAFHEGKLTEEKFRAKQTSIVASDLVIDDRLEALRSDLRRMDARADGGRAFHEGKLTEEQFRKKLSDLGVSQYDADLECIYNHPSNKDWAER